MLNLKKQCTNKLIYKTEIVTDIENKHVVMWGWGRLGKGKDKWED